eukprot:scaffold215859_cov40-Cyclotella_meneghiniana.AAC.2
MEPSAFTWSNKLPMSGRSPWFQDPNHAPRWQPESRRNSMGIQNEYGDNPAAAFADLFGAPEDLGAPEDAVDLFALTDEGCTTNAEYHVR